MAFLSGSIRQLVAACFEAEERSALPESATPHGIPYWSTANVDTALAATKPDCTQRRVQIRLAFGSQVELNQGTRQGPLACREVAECLEEVSWQ
jgi:hypothetical protein